MDEQLDVSDMLGTVIGPLEIGPVAHGGHCVARHEGRVVFVRHALPGERVMARLTDVSRRSFWRADATEVLEASLDRVDPVCPVAGRCGGCDFQHVTLEGQRELKRRVVAEQLSRLAGISWDGTVESVEPCHGWRTRSRFVVDRSSGVPVVGMREHRSHDIVEIPARGCLIAHSSGPTVQELVEIAQECSGDEIRVIVPGRGEPVVLSGDPRQDVPLVCEEVLGHRHLVRADGFWQIHPKAGSVLVQAVLDGLRPVKGEQALDLYCGVGLFAGALSDAGCRVMGVEQVAKAVAQARRNVVGAKFIAAPMARALKSLPKCDVVVLDPPRTGAGAQVVRHVAALDARAIAYVACDPAALARDLATFAEQGWRPRSIRAFDLFPMTHHVECVAILERG